LSVPRGGEPHSAARMASCASCGTAFASRNALFRHLKRDGPCRVIDDDDDASTSSMGARAGVHKTSVARAFDARARGEDGPARAYASTGSGRSHKKEKDMTKDEVRALNERRRQRAARRKELRARGGDSSGTAASDPRADLWLGGLSGSAGTMKGAREVIWHAMPHNSDLPQPQVKFIKRRGYKQNGEWKAFAFLQCRDEDEARVFQAAMNEVSVTLKDGVTSVLKVRPAVYKNTMSDAKAAPAEVAPPARALPPGEHPPAREIFMAWTAKDLEHRALARGMTHDALIDEAVASNASYVNLRGVAVDRAATKRLRLELLRSKWPARSQRRGVNSDGYIVLKRELSPNDPYAKLKDACEKLMRTVDATFPYDSLAITKNFISSAHLDKDDKSHQYSMSFGAFTGGGELCVESKDGKTRWMIDTRERLARFDGRSVHWVRGYSGDRLSVVWYVNRESNFTPQRYDVDETFVGIDDVDATPSRCVVQ
jgi:hypothetical protein